MTRRNEPLGAARRRAVTVLAVAGFSNGRQLGGAVEHDAAPTIIGHRRRKARR